MLLKKHTHKMHEKFKKIVFLCERTTNDTNILTTGQEERTKIMFLLFMQKSLKSFFFLTIFVNKTYNQYGIQVKKIKHLFLSLHFVCY